MEQRQEKPILVIGGTGKTGRRIVQRLQDRNIPVRVGSRNADIPFIWEDESTWPEVLDGVETAYVAYFPDLAVASALPVITAFADKAEEMGLKRVVLLSGRGEPGTIPCENQIKRFDWTVLRVSWFNQNFDESFFCDPLRAGVLQLPVNDTPEPFIDADDIADAAVAALTESGHSGKLYELTGPRALNFKQAVAEISAAAGHPIRFEPISAEAYREAMIAHGVPADVTDLTLYLYGEVLDGRNENPSNGVRELLGREAKDFADYAREAAARGAWTPFTVACG